MGMYATGVFPLPHLNETSNEVNEITKHLAFTDDFTGSGKLQELQSRWDTIVNHGTNIGYYPKSSKSWLTVKQQYFDNAIKIFEGTSVKNTMRGRRHQVQSFEVKNTNDNVFQKLYRIGSTKMSVCLISLKLSLMKHTLHLSSAINTNSHIIHNANCS